MLNDSTTSLVIVLKTSLSRNTISNRLSYEPCGNVISKIPFSISWKVRQYSKLQENATEQFIQNFISMFGVFNDYVGQSVCTKRSCYPLDRFLFSY